MPGVFQWSQTAAANASADPTINYAEGQAPSSLNDSARAAMASIAKYRDDLSGMLVTTGTAQNYAVSSNQGFDTLTDFHNKTIFFTPHLTNTGSPVTLTVDGFANLPLRSAPGIEIPAGTISKGTPYGAIYNNTDGALYLQGFYGQPLAVPLLGGMDHWDTITPNSSFIFPVGQLLNRTTYAYAFSKWGTFFSAGDGSTTFGAPDKRSKVSAAADNMGGTSAGVTPFAFLASAGAAAETLTTPNLPPYTPGGSVTNGAISATAGGLPAEGLPGTSFSVQTGGAGIGYSNANGLVFTQGASAFNGSAQGGTSTPFSILQPMIFCNYIIRVL